MDKEVKESLDRVTELKKKDKKVTEEYLKSEKEVVDQCFSVLKKTLLESGLVKDAHIGNNKGILDCDGLKFDVCDTVKVPGHPYPDYLWVFDITFNLNDGFKLRFEQSGPHKEIHRFLNRNKRKILSQIGSDQFQALYRLDQEMRKTRGEIYDLMRKIEHSL